MGSAGLAYGHESQRKDGIRTARVSYFHNFGMDRS